MRSRVLLSACAVALAATSCAQPEPQVLSEAPMASSSTGVSTTTGESEPDGKDGRFIARCATEADGGEPGDTVFTNGSRGITDHCLSRYYIGLQPAPGSLYVADGDAGTYAPSRGSDTVSAGQWTPEQPRTDVGPVDRRPGDPLAPVPTRTQTDPKGTGTPKTESPENDAGTGTGTGTDTDADSTIPSGPVTPPEETTTEEITPGGTTPVETSPPLVAPTTPASPAPSTPPGGTVPTTSPAPPVGTAPPTTTGASGVIPHQPGTSVPGSSPGVTAPPTTVPTVVETAVPNPAPPRTSVMSTAPAGLPGSGWLPFVP